jgi:hypothetical protein
LALDAIARSASNVRASHQTKINPDVDVQNVMSLSGDSSVDRWHQELLIMGLSIVFTSFFLESDSLTVTGGVPSN